jgi:hypothetical protein
VDQNELSEVCKILMLITATISIEVSEDFISGTLENIVISTSAIYFDDVCIFPSHNTFHVILRTNSNYFPKQQQQTGLCVGDAVRFI